MPLVTLKAAPAGCWATPPCSMVKPVPVDEGGAGLSGWICCSMEPAPGGVTGSAANAQK